MRKFFIILIPVFVILFPTFGLADDNIIGYLKSVSALNSSLARNGHCPIHDADFCACYTSKAIAGCKEYMPAPFCTIGNIISAEKMNIRAACSRGCNDQTCIDECVIATNYFIENCKY